MTTPAEHERIQASVNAWMRQSSWNGFPSQKHYQAYRDYVTSCLYAGKVSLHPWDWMKAIGQDLFKRPPKMHMKFMGRTQNGTRYVWRSKEHFPPGTRRRLTIACPVDYFWGKS